MNRVVRRFALPAQFHVLADWCLQGRTLGPVSKKRLLETWQKFKTESKSKVNLI